MTDTRNLFEKYADAGGPAFPANVQLDVGQVSFAGMSLRDWFAGQALAGGTLGERHPNGGSQTDQTPQAIARDAYRIADAMIAAREGGQS